VPASFCNGENEGKDGKGRGKKKKKEIKGKKSDRCQGTADRRKSKLAVVRTLTQASASTGVAAVRENSFC
jgi:hypothetical protein